MSAIAYTSPLVPVEWIAAHGLRPCWLRLGSVNARPRVAVRRGVCPYAGAVVDAAVDGLDAAGLVMTTICDQMRYAAAMIESASTFPLFLMNVPSTWQSDAARNLYREELARLGRFLVRCGGSTPTDAELAAVMAAYDRARADIFAVRDRLTGRQFAEAMVAVREGMPWATTVEGVCGRAKYGVRSTEYEATGPECAVHSTEYRVPSTKYEDSASLVRHPKPSDPESTAGTACCPSDAPYSVLRTSYSTAGTQDSKSAGPTREPDTSYSALGTPHSLPATPPAPFTAIRLALLGGPLLERDYAIYDLLERAGGRVVLDATEIGERTLPAPFDPQRLAHDPVAELVHAYFDRIPDVFRRPNNGLYQWLQQELAVRRVQGILMRRYVWCDLWHAEFARLREWSPVPVLDLDASGEEDCAMARTLGRIEAFLETLA